MYTRRSTAVFARLRSTADGLSFETSYDSGLVSELKIRIPATDRKWDSSLRVWLVSPQYGDVCAEIAQSFLGIQVAVPAVVVVPVGEVRLVRVDYLGRTKDRGNGEPSAFGWVDGTWCIVFPESVLRDWFDAVPQTPGEKATLFAVLLVKQDVTPDALRTAYRRLAMQWHPDRCHEPDAAEQFMAIQHAWEVLSDPTMRRKYQAGLALQGSIATRGPTQAQGIGQQYRSPLRCGWVLCDGIQQLGRFVASQIITWVDIVDDAGRVMCVSWPMGAEKFETAWI